MFMNQRAAIQNRLLTTSAATAYTAPANTVARLSSVTFTNQGVVAATVTAHLVAAGSSAGNNNRVVNGYVIGPGESWTCPHLNHNLNPGDQLMVQSDTSNAVSVYGSVIEMSRA